VETTIEIKNRLDGKNVIFSHTCDNNTLKLTVELAIKRGVDLQNADLESANLYGANLTSANLTSANLESANLESANLC
jgi:uncharacterized protein YjbI with pentapeptide repeats